MLDEPASNYEPAHDATPTEPKPLEKPSAPPTEAAPPTQDAERPFGLPTRRPFWINITSYVVAFLAVSRFCNALTLTQDPTRAAVQVASAVVLAVILAGMLSMRRWGAGMFIGLSAWMVLHSLILAGFRYAAMDEVAESSGDRWLVISAILVELGFNALIFGGLGILYALRLKHFRQTPSLARYGLLPFVLMFGILILYTATLIPTSENYVRTLLEDSDTNSNVFPF